MKKYFEVYPATSIGEAEKIVGGGNKEFSVICNNGLSGDVAAKLMPRDEVKTIIIFCAYLKKGEENVQNYKSKFEMAFNFLNDAIEYLIEKEEKNEESNSL